MTPKPNRHVFVESSAQESARQCSAYVIEKLSEALKSSGRATFAISGGNTPKALFAELAEKNFDWSSTHIFWVDERCVPPDDDQSNYKMAKETLLDPAAIPQRNVHRIRGELPPNEAASRYVEEIRNSIQLEGDALPAFDVIHRGIGSDAHTASLFPGEPLISDRTGIAAPVWVEKMKSHRVTLLPGVLLAARQTIIQAAGNDKAEPIHQVLEGPEDPFRFPCQLATRGFENVAWFLDRAAASQL